MFRSIRRWPGALGVSLGALLGGCSLDTESLSFDGVPGTGGQGGSAAGSGGTSGSAGSGGAGQGGLGGAPSGGQAGKSGSSGQGGAGAGGAGKGGMGGAGASGGQGGVGTAGAGGAGASGAGAGGAGAGGAGASGAGAGGAGAGAGGAGMSGAGQGGVGGGGEGGMGGAGAPGCIEGEKSCAPGKVFTVCSMGMTMTTQCAPQEMCDAQSGCVAAIDVVAGAGRSCSILSNGTALCWGNNAKGALGVGVDDASSPTPRLVVDAEGKPLQGIKEMALGDDFSCARTNAGGKVQVFCWGNDSQGQLGDGPQNTTRNHADLDNPVLFDAGTLLTTGFASQTSLSAGGSTACVVTKSGSVQCWGRGLEGQLGTQLKQSSPVPLMVKGVSGATTLAVGYLTTCAAASSSNQMVAFCWGNNSLAEVGANIKPSGGAPTSDNILTPSVVKVSAQNDMSGVSQIAAGGAEVGTGGPDPIGHACAISNGNLRCWGAAFSGQLGPSSPPSSAFYSEIALGVGLPVEPSQVTVAGSHTCVLSKVSVYCFGSNWAGELGVPPAGDNPMSKNPVKIDLVATRLASGATTGLVADPITQDQFVVAFGHNCALTDESPPAIRCWGRNTSGQLGYVGADTSTPTLVQFP